MEDRGSLTKVGRPAEAEDVRTFLDGSVRGVAPLTTCIVGLGTYRPGWRWRDHAGAQTGLPSARHVGYVVSGRLVVQDAAGVQTPLGPGDAFELAPGHDAWVVGDEPCVALDFAPRRPSPEKGGDPLPDYVSRGARAAILLHEETLHAFITTWRRCRAAGLVLPPVADPDYASLDALLRHVLRWARGYLVWICAQLELPEPPLEAAPPSFAGDAGLDAHVTQLLAAWRIPLRDVPAARFRDREYTAPWGVRYCIDAMLEHAAMHPLRHRFQLEELLSGE